MFVQTGSKIPDGQLCLTFDDGPGPHTAEISSFLRDQEISATFFLIGKLIAANRSVVQQLIKDGHEIGNHTHTHRKLTDHPFPVEWEIKTAHQEIRPFVADSQKPLFFRPPYGCWPTIPNLNDAMTPQGERLGNLYSGPISWDFDQADWSSWENAKGADDADALATAVARYSGAQRGVVLMHDHNFEPYIAAKNQTFRMIKQLIPRWRAQGCTFISLRDAHGAGYLDIRM
jgi:peptidoglycan-N-acetylglucosamine deacetylase